MEGGQPLVPAWVRVLVVLTVLPVWILVVGVSLLRGHIPDTAMMAIPGAVIVAAAPAWRWPGGKGKGGP